MPDLEQMFVIYGSILAFTDLFIYRQATCSKRLTRISELWSLSDKAKRSGEQLNWRDLCFLKKSYRWRRSGGIILPVNSRWTQLSAITLKQGGSFLLQLKCSPQEQDITGAKSLGHNVLGHDFLGQDVRYPIWSLVSGCGDLLY